MENEIERPKKHDFSQAPAKKRSLSKELKNKLSVPHVSVFKYISYRDYLKDYYHFKKSQNPNFSFANFALKAKINTPNYLKRVIDGERSLNAESIPKFCMGLALTSRESVYFEALVNFNQSKDDDIKKHYFGIMRKTSEEIPGSALEIFGDQFEVFNHWYILAVRELVLLKGFQENPLYIVRLMKNKIRKKEAEFALSTLLKLGMLKHDERGKLIQTQPMVRYSQDVVNLTVREFHKQMLTRTKEALAEDEFGTWNVRALSLAVKKEKFQELYQKISDFIYSLNKEYSESTNNNEKDLVVQINCQMLQLTEANEPVKYQILKNEKGEGSYENKS